MSVTGIIGTLALSIDEGENAQNVASLLSCELQFETEMLPALHPTVYGWEYFIPGNQDWRGDASMMQLIDTETTLREVYLQLLEQYFLEKTLLSAEFTSPAGGAVYSATGYLDAFELGAAENDAFTGAFGFQGVTSIELVEGE